ncbi:MAG: PaaI family thioesterase, partial [Deltaproteobacteria bacterium]|nr:PaaI family thioesterase [Deltaproteobacteria bacterium]
TVDLKLNYLAPVASGRLIAKGRQIKLGRALGYADAEVRDGDGRLVAHGSSTLMVLPGRGLTTEPPLPPKFL